MSACDPTKRLGVALCRILIPAIMALYPLRASAQAMTEDQAVTQVPSSVQPPVQQGAVPAELVAPSQATTPASEVEAEPPQMEAVPVDQVEAVPPANSQDGDFSAFDLYVGGVNCGAVYGRFGDGWFEPSEPADIVPLLPSVRNPQDFVPLFTGRIEKVRMIKDIGTLKIDDVNFKIDVEVDKSAAMLATVGEIDELKATDADFGVRNALFMAGSSATDSFDVLKGISARHDTIVSRGATSFQASGNLSQEGGYDLKNALLRRDFKRFGQDLTGYAGLLETSSNIRFAKSLNFMGMRLASNQDLIFRDEQLQGSNLEIFLPRRAQVEIFRDSEGSRQVLYSRIMDFGTVQIDTRNFPRGSYDVEIVVRDGGTVISRETRPFIKTQNLPPRGKPVISLDAGFMRNDLDVQSTPVMEASYRTRIFDWLGGSLGVATTDHDQVYEVSLSSQNNIHVFKAMGLIETSLTGAFAGAMEPAGVEASLSFKTEKMSASLIGSKIYKRNGGAGDFDLSDRESIDFNFSMPMEVAGYKFYTGFTAGISDTEDAPRDYRYGPSLGYTFSEIGGYTPELKLEYSSSNTDNRLLGTLTLRQMAPVWTKDAEVSVSRIGADDSLSGSLGYGFDGKSSLYEDWRKKMAAHLGLRFDPLASSERETLTALSSDVEYTGKLAQGRGYLTQNLIGSSTGQFGGEMESTLLWSPKKGFSATSQTVGADSALVMVSLRGNPGGKLDVRVDGMSRATGKAGDNIVLTIPVYEKAQIDAIDKQGKGMYKVREKAQTVVGYPGNIAYREFTIVKSMVMTGTLLDSRRMPLVNTRFLVNGTAYYTDETGFFAIEESGAVGEKIDMDAKLYSCSAVLPDMKEDENYVDLSYIECADKKPE